MALKKKYYVVWQGHNPGIFETWGETQQEINGYSGAKYKAFKSKQEAETAFYETNYDEHTKKSIAKPKIQKGSYPTEVVQNSFSVDAACSGNPGRMEYQGVYVDSGTRLFHQGPFDMGTNNVGEFLALVHALALFKGKPQENMTIYTDSRTAMAWLRKAKANTKLKELPKNRKLFELIRRAESWTKNNNWKNPIVKWDTKNWGEIPADFGRK